MSTYIRSILFGLCLCFFANISFASVEYFYNMPPNDNPFDRGPRANLIQEIDHAKKRIEASFYQVGDPKIVDAFARAAERGLDVTITTDADWYNNTTYDFYPDAKKRFAKAGVVVIDDFRARETDPSEDGSKLSHNKYCIIDRGTSRARVWMGSANITPQGSLENANASFLFIEKKVADIFYADFSQMAEGRFQKEKGGVFHVVDSKGRKKVVVVEDKDGTPAGLEYKDFLDIKGTVSYPSMEIEDSTVEFYFSPRHNIQQKVVEALYGAKESIHFASYGLENRMIYQTIMNKALVAEPKDGFFEVQDGMDGKGVQHIPYYEDYNLLPVAVRGELWTQNEKMLRVGNEEGGFEEEVIDKERWQSLYEKHGGKENEGRFYRAASYFYEPGKAGGPVTKVPVYGIFNRLGASKGPYPKMREMGIPVRFGAFRGALHHKFIMVDRKILILGSYNFSTSAETQNDESLIIVRDEEIVNQFYEDVYVNLYKNAYPERTPYEEEINQYQHEQATVEITEINFNPIHGAKGRYVELYNYGTESVDLTGWKMWNGNIPWHVNPKLSGSTDDLVSFYNRPLTNEFGLNHPTKAYFLEPELQMLHPGEYALVVGRDFNPKTLLEYYAEHEKNFIEVWGKEPEAWYEVHPKLFVSSAPNDAAVGNGLKPYNFVTLFYPDKYTIADRFVLNWSFRDEEKSGSLDDMIFGRGVFKLDLERGQSIERINYNAKRLSRSYDVYAYDFDDEYTQYWYGLEHYSSARDWARGAASPGFAGK